MPNLRTHALRKLHRKTAPILFLPLAITAVTGIGFSLVVNWFGVEEEKANFFLDIHQGEYLGDFLVPIYVLLVALGLIGMIVTGLSMTSLFSKGRSKPGSKLSFRKVHRILAPILVLPFAASAFTGLGFSIAVNWLGFKEEDVDFLLDIHQGEYLGDTLKSIYVLLIGLGLIVLLITGINMTGIFRKHSPHSVESESHTHAHSSEVDAGEIKSNDPDAE